MNSRRRQFVKSLVTAGVTMPFIARRLYSEPPSRMLHHASFGAGGMAWADIQAITSNSFVKLVAVAEVDLNRISALKAWHPETRIYQDWRELLEKERDLDSVNVSTPDHMHAPIALSAMQLGKHVYCQKPLAHDLHETRVLTEFARGKNLVTQMGIQVHSQKPYRQAVALVQSGAIGRIKEVHAWSGKKLGDLGAPRPTGENAPAGFNWDLWLGGCEFRPYVGNGYYHPGQWRRRLDFGTGTLGDMGCHIFDPIFKSLGLTAPLSIRSEGPAPDRWNWTTNARITYIFPRTAHTEGDKITVTWYDGDERPPDEIMRLINSSTAGLTDSQKRASLANLEQGSIFVGTKGVMHVPHVAAPRLFPEDAFVDFIPPSVTGAHHWSDWAESCLSGGKPSADFDYSGPLSEAVLLGGIAMRFPHTTLEWDASSLRFTNLTEANRHLRRSYREGWQVAGL